MELTLDFTNFWRPLLAVILSFLIARTMNWAISWQHHKRIMWAGGMPSVHTASVIGLLMTIIIEDGLAMPALIAGVFACVVINDALGVRWETSKHAKFLNELTKTKRFQIVGHRPIEVLVGAAIGIAIPILFYAFV